MKDYSKLSKEQLIDTLILLVSENLILDYKNKKQAKQLDLHVVSHRRELLINFMQWHFDNDEFKNEPVADNIVDKYLKIN